MKEIRWERVKQIFEAALSVPMVERARVLDHECADDARLRGEIEALLEARTLGAPRPAHPSQESAKTTAGPLTERPGLMIGSYKLLQLLGEGGFGCVFMAQQEHPVRRRVALKIIKLGMDTRQVIARFEAERQALAMMDHPHIAKVLDAGATDTGRPYFVMELVNGEPITTYSDTNNLNIRERLELFAQVCFAVQHAHTKGIIHRDLKPNNVLVSTLDGKPLAKVIDFGVAKATAAPLTDKTIFTELRQLVGTPVYMSPEQAVGSLDIDTRADVYSLGALLYELLTGATLFDAGQLQRAALDEVQRIIREVEPAKPSTRISQSAQALASVAAHRKTEPRRLGVLVRGELDWIVMKAVDKDRSRRYATANALALDVGRYLSGEPVAAAPPTLGYKVAKFVQRNRVFAAGGVIVATVVVLAAIISGTMWARAATARDNLHKTVEALNRSNNEKQAALQHETEAREAEQKAREEANRAKEKALADRDAAERGQYLANIIAADAAFLRGEPRRARQRLEACPPRLRGWEWNYLNAQGDSSLLALDHGAPVSSAAFSPDGTLVLGAGSAPVVHVWEAATGRLAATLSGHSDPVWCAQFSPDGKRIVTASEDRTSRVWDLATQSEVSLMSHRSRVNWVAFSPDGAHVISVCNDGSAVIWDADTGDALHTLKGHEDAIDCASFSPDGAWVATASADHTTRLWNAKTGEPGHILTGPEGVWRLAFSGDGTRLVTVSLTVATIWDAKTGALLRTLKGHHDSLWSAVFSPDGRTVLTSAYDGIRVWDAADGSTVHEIRHTGVVRSARYDPEGRIILACTDQAVRAWSLRTGEELAVFNGHTAEVRSAAFSPDGSRIVTASYDGTVRLWDASMASLPFRPTDTTATPERVVLSTGGPRAVTILAGTLRLWDTVTGRDLGALDEDTLSASFTHDGRAIVAVASSQISVWDSAFGRRLNTLTPPTEFMYSMDFSPDGVHIAAAVLNWKGVIWDGVKGAQTATLEGHSASISTIVYSPDGNTIVTASDDGTARTWNAQTGAPLHVLSGHSGHVSDVIFSDRGDLIATLASDKTARIWNAVDGSLVAQLKTTKRFWNGSFSPDSSRIITTDEDSTAQVWDARSGAPLFKLREETRAYAAAFSPDGSRILTASTDNSARLWDAETGTELLVLRGKSLGGLPDPDRRYQRAEFSPDGSRILRQSPAGSAWWDSVPYRERYRACESFRAAERAAKSRLQHRLTAKEPIPKVREAVLADPSMSEVDRRACLAVLAHEASLPDPADVREDHALMLDARGWAMVRYASVDPADAEAAIKILRQADKINPEHPRILASLAGALYRHGDYEESLATAMRSEKLLSADSPEPDMPRFPTNWAFIAMSQFQLGHKDEAAASLEKLRGLVHSRAHASHEGDRILLQQAETTLSGARPR